MTLNEFIEVMFLAVVQGIAEFLPISSSGHLVVLGKLFERWLGDPAAEEKKNIILNLALHVGTLASILVVYRKDLWGIWRRPKLCLAVVVATIPATLAYKLLKDYVEATFEMPIVVACGWLVTAGLLWYAPRARQGDRSLNELTMGDAVKIGCFQAVSLLFRGVSRSGSTISGGLFTGLSREAAAEFSFLIAIPAIAGGAVLKVLPLVKAHLLGTPSLAEGSSALVGGYSPLALVVGTLTSFVVGLISLRWLLRIVVQRGLDGFVYYVLTASLLTFVWQGYEYFAK
jgi:undecaprenyl-diphosphatase